MKAGFQFQKNKQYAQLPSPAFHSINQIFFFCLFILLNPAHALNTDTVIAVDHRVKLTNSTIKHDPKHKSYTGIESVLLKPHANPYALVAGSGKITVRFSVPLLGKLKSTDTVFLRRIGEKESISMNDIGKDGDFKAGDNIFGVNVLIDTSKVKQDTCLKYEAFTKIDRVDLISAPLQLCVSSIPVYLEVPNIDIPAVFPDGSKAVGDEILLRATLKASAADIKQIANNINAKIVGSDLNLNLYQLKLPSPVKVNQLLEIISQIKSQKGVANAFVNALGGYAFSPSDTEFPSQHGLQLTRAHDAWDSNANANGVGNTVIVLDSGIDRSHIDFGTSPGNCQLAEDDCGMASTDTLGHGTQVAGVVSAKTNNATGVAGVAFGSKIHSIQVSPIISIAATQMITGFNLARDYLAIHADASVINASFSVGVGAASASEWDSVCLAIDQAVFNGAARAIVVNAVGNLNANGTLYPARCNDLNANLDITRKNLLITVANSTSIVTPDCGSVAIDQRCSTSNYGAWVDIAAPGSAIRTTALGGGYASPTGTSFSAPIVSGAVAILKSCGVPLIDIESTLRTSANVTISFPGGTSAPRLDIYRALQQRNLAPTAVSLSGGSISENTDTSAGFEVGTLTAVDPNTCDKFTYSLNGGADAALFSIGGVNADRLRLTAGILNYEVKNAYHVTVRVTDFFGQTFDQPLTVNVTNVNEAPIIANQTFTTPENWMNSVPNGTVVGTVAASDPDIGDTLSYAITAGNVGGAFSINPGTGVISVANNIALNYEVTPNFNLTVQVTDAGIDGAPLSASATITVILTNDLADNGDPHITTVNGLHYDFQSAGEFVALRGANGMEIQTRQTPVSTAAPITDSYSGLTSGVSVNTAVAARVGNHRVTLQPNISGLPVASGLELRVDGVVTTLPADGLNLGSGGRVLRLTGGAMQVDFPDSTTMIVTPGFWAPHNVWYLNLDVYHTPARSGLMGALVKGSWLPRLSNGTSLGSRPAALHDRYVELYEKFADSWRVNNKSSLFDYAPDTSTKTFTFDFWPRETPPYVIPHETVAQPVERKVAQRACREVADKNRNADCVFDVRVTGEIGFAKTYLLSQKIRAGLTSITVRDDRDPTRPNELVTFTATVTRVAAIKRQKFRGRRVSAGTVQFMHDGRKVGEPVRLNAKGQARWKESRLEVGKHQIAARYLPAKGSELLGSSSLDESHLVKEKPE